MRRDRSLIAADLRRPAPADVADHIDSVLSRLEVAARDDAGPAEPMRLAVLLHEEAPERVPALLERAGLATFTPLVTAVIAAFGRLWKLGSDNEAVDYVRAHGAYLGPLLPFELVHEGAPASWMRNRRARRPRAPLRGLGPASRERPRRVRESEGAVMRAALLAACCLMTVATAGFAQTKPSGDCGEVVTIPTHDQMRMRYALSRPAATQGEPIAVVLLPGGGGHLDLDAKGCPRALKGNSLVRSIPYFNDLGFVTALVDSPSDLMDEDGLAGFRSSSKHAEDLGRTIEDVRTRTKGPAWVVGTSRGTISAANVASRAAGPTAPDGVVLTSALTVGSRSNQRPWLSQTVFDLPLDKIRVPVLIVGHAADTCLRSPATMMTRIADRTNGVRKQVVTVTGGPGLPASTSTSIDACGGRSPHGFVEQEVEVAAGIARFIRGGSY